MRIGTPGFCGARLTEAREARGLSQASLAELAQLKAQSVSQYEQGKQSPSPEALETICEKLNLPERFFLRPLVEHSTERITYRSLSSATKTARIRAERRLGWLKDIVVYLRAYLEFPGINMPAFNLPDDPTKITMAQIEGIADECRSYWNLGYGPLKDVVLLLENAGVILVRTNFGVDSLDAFSQWDSGVPFVFLNADKGSAVRSRFDAAHELGHLVLHRHLLDKQIKNLAIHSILENQAHRFAGALLLPERSFSQEVWAPTLDAFVSLKKHWRCAVAMMVSRCEHLGMLDEVQVKRAWINLSRRGWRTEEPLDNVLEPEEPKLLRRSFQLLIEEGIKTREEITMELRLNPFDVEDLAGLPRGYLSGVSILEQPTIRVRKEEQAHSNRSVINFPSKLSS